MIECKITLDNPLKIVYSQDGNIITDFSCRHCAKHLCDSAIERMSLLSTYEDIFAYTDFYDKYKVTGIKFFEKRLRYPEMFPMPWEFLPPYNEKSERKIIGAISIALIRDLKRYIPQGNIVTVIRGGWANPKIAELLRVKYETSF